MNKPASLLFFYFFFLVSYTGLGKSRFTVVCEIQFILLFLSTISFSIWITINLLFLYPISSQEHECMLSSFLLNPFNVWILYYFPKFNKLAVLCVLISSSYSTLSYYLTSVLLLWSAKWPSHIQWEVSLITCTYMRDLCKP